jgi:hypothetical protein
VHSVDGAAQLLEFDARGNPTSVPLKRGAIKRREWGSLWMLVMPPYRDTEQIEYGPLLVDLLTTMRDQNE